MLQVGLTGGIGSGKSTVARMFEEKGACLIDFDELTHYVEEPDRPGWTAIVEYFTSDVLNADRTINRQKLGAIVFHDKQKLADLNRIVHPVIFKEWRRRLAELSQKTPRAIVISEAPLLIEIGMKPLFDLVILVYASPDDQVQRLMLRNKLSKEDAYARIASQMPIDDKIPLVDFVIDNQSPLEKIGTVVHEIWEKLLIRNSEK